MAETGYLVISDITGYTAFLSGSELDHAEDSLKSLLDLLIEETKPPLVISRLQGDAVISYAPQGSFLQGQTLVEMLENTYVAFRQARQRMRLNTTCPCNACQNIPNLDLKFFVHFGDFALQETPTYTELVGVDVNLIHRMMKNSITKSTGISAYAAYTAAVVSALGMEVFARELVSHTESYEHIGKVQLYIQDLAPVWSRESVRQRVFVEPNDALFVLEGELPIPPALAWDYATKPEFRKIFFEADTMELQDLNGGRAGAGSVYYCAHGEEVFTHPILDWKPFEYYTVQANAILFGQKLHITTRLIPTENGTKVIGLSGKALGGGVKSWINNQLLLRIVLPGARAANAVIIERIKQDLESGAVVTSEKVTVDPDQISTAAHESVAAPASG